MEDDGRRDRRQWLTATLLVAVGAVAWLVLTGRTATVEEAAPEPAMEEPRQERAARPSPAAPLTSTSPRVPRPDAEPIRIDGDVERPVKISGPNPRYTEMARKARIQGVVIVEAIITKDGSVADVRILKPLPMGLDQAAVDAVRQWRFKPAKLDGKLVDVYYNLTINFRLQ